MTDASPRDPAKSRFLALQLVRLSGAALAMTGLAYLLLMRAETYPQFVGLMIMIGLSNPLYQVGADAMLADMIPSEKRTALPVYEGGTGYQPLGVWWAEQGLWVRSQFRDGNVPAQQEPLTCAQLAFAALPPADKDIQRDDLNHLKGLFQREPYAAIMIGLAMLSLAGIPPFPGFVAKFLIFRNVMEAGFTLYAVLGLVGSYLGIYFYLRVIQYMFMAEHEPTAARGAPRRLAVIASVLCLVPAVLLSAVAGVYGVADLAVMQPTAGAIAVAGPVAGWGSPRRP